MHLVERIDDIGRPAWIALMVLGFIVWWPAGLAILGFLLWSRRMGCGRGDWGAWKQARLEHKLARWERVRERLNSRMHGHGRWSSGNTAFDAYRQETLRRLEDEQSEFTEYLENLRQAKDKAEFDQFMADRRNRQTPPPSAPAPGAPGPDTQN
jgi:Protein of unknown function (DUF2852)